MVNKSEFLRITLSRSPERAPTLAVQWVTRCIVQTVEKVGKVEEVNVRKVKTSKAVVKVEKVERVENM